MILHQIEVYRGALVTEYDLTAMMDDPALLPDDTAEAFWWEVWLPVRENRAAVISDFRAIVTSCRCRVSEHSVSFPERTVTWMHGSQSAFSQSVTLAQNQCSAKSEIFVFPETSDEFSRSHVI